MSHFEKREAIPVWEAVKKFVNYNVKIGQQFTRKELLSHVYTNNLVIYISHHSTDTYINLLKRLEYIYAIKPGIYIKRDNIPGNASLSLVRKVASNKKEWKEWFIPTEDRRQRIKKICESQRKKKLSIKLKVKKKDL